MILHSTVTVHCLVIYNGYVMKTHKVIYSIPRKQYNRLKLNSHHILYKY